MQRKRLVLNNYNNTMKDLIIKQDRYNQELHQKVYASMEKFSKNPSNANRYFEEVMVEFNNQRDIVRKETAERILDIVEKQGTEICQGLLPRAIYGLLIDFKKIKKQILKDLK